MPEDLLTQKPDDDEAQKPLFNADTPQRVYDDEFEKMRERGQLGEDPEDKSLSPDGLADAEQSANNPASGSAAEKETTSLENQVGSGYKSDDQPAGLGRLKALLPGSLNRKKALLGGGVTGIILTLAFGFFSFSSLEAIHVRENMLGKSNSLVNKAMQNRRARSFSKIVRKLNQGKLTDRIKPGKMKAKLENQGFRLTFSEDGKLTELHYAPDGKLRRSFKIDEPDLRKATKDFFGNGDLGREISQRFDNATGTRAVTWRGKFARRLYGYFGTNLRDWLDNKRKASRGEEPTTPNEEFSEDYNAANEAEGGTKAPEIKSPVADADGDGKPDIDENGLNDFNPDANEIDKAKKGYKNPLKAIAEKLKQTEAVSRLLDSKAGTFLTKDLNQSFANKLKIDVGKIAPETAKAGSRLGDALNFVGLEQLACRVRGGLRFAAHARNIYVSYQLARFALRFLIATDNQKAGLIQSDGLKLLMIYLHTPNPDNGKSYSQAGGFQNVIMGDKTSKPSSLNASAYNTGRGHPGLLGRIDSFLSFAPPTACRFVNNGLVSFGGLVVGLVAGFVSGGTFTAAQFGTGLALGFAQEAAVRIVEGITTRALSGAVITGFENGEQAGDALGSGWGSVRGMNAGVNGLKPIKKSAAAKLALEVQADEHYETSQKSLFARYFDLHETNSLATRLAFTFSPKLNMLPSLFINLGLGLPSFALPNGQLASWLPGTSRALAAEDECQDPQIKKFDLEADVFCNPEVADAPDIDGDSIEILKNQPRPFIDAQNQPIDYPGADNPSEDLADYIKLCHSGRVGILYNLDDKQSEDNIKNGNMEPALDVCADPSGGAPLPGDNVGRYIRFTDYYGNQVDEENFIEDINDDFESAAAVDTTPTPTGDQKIEKYTPALATPGGKITPKGITLHWWGGNSNGAGINSLANTLRGRGLSVQFGITSDGKIYQMTANEDDLSHHAKGGNATTFGVEIEGGPKDFGANGPTNNPAKFEAIVYLVKYLSDKYNINKVTVSDIECGNVLGIHPHKAYNKCGNTKIDIDDAYFNAVMEEVRRRSP